MCCLPARISYWGFCRRLHVRFRVAAHEVGELAHGLRGIGWPWQCGRAVVEGVVKVVVPSFSASDKQLKTPPPIVRVLDAKRDCYMDTQSLQTQFTIC